MDVRTIVLFGVGAALGYYVVAHFARTKKVA